MSRTEGSGWGGGVIFYQRCPHCNKKKAMYSPIYLSPHCFKCTSCKERFASDKLHKITHVSQIRCEHCKYCIITNKDCKMYYECKIRIGEQARVESWNCCTLIEPRVEEK